MIFLNNSVVTIMLEISKLGLQYFIFLFRRSKIMLSYPSKVIRRQDWGKMRQVFTEYETKIRKMKNISYYYDDNNPPT